MSKYKTVRRIVMMICSACWGSGLAVGGKCATCQGKGEVERVVVEIVHDETLTTP